MIILRPLESHDFSYFVLLQADICICLFFPLMYGSNSLPLLNVMALGSVLACRNVGICKSDLDLQAMQMDQQIYIGTYKPMQPPHCVELTLHWNIDVSIFSWF